MTSEQLVETIDEYCRMGLNSPDPIHWEAALQDILDMIRNNYEYEGIPYHPGELK